MKVLFVGGTGTISSACASLCVQEGMDLYLMLRGSRDHRIPKGAQVLHADIRKNPAEAKSLLDAHEWDCIVDWVAFEERELLQDLELFSGRAKQFVFVSSASAYQKPLPPGEVTEMTATGNRFWDYAEKKARCERLLLQRRDEGFPVVIVRPSATYAEFTLPTGIAGWGFGLIHRLKAGKPILVHDDGAGLWTLTFNEDFARGLVPLLGNSKATGEVFHITSDERLSWLDIYDLIGREFGYTPRFVFAPAELINRFDTALGATLLGDKAHSYCFDNSKIKRFVPSFKAGTLFQEGLKRCHIWYDQHQLELSPNEEKAKFLDRIIAHVEQSSPKILK